ncbi:MAG: CapA family protein [Chloroflexi bacterium]|nr:CapA family protein [Chloroflexota bacterium]
MRKFLALLLAITTACVMAAPSLSVPVCAETAGRVERNSYRSQIAETNMYYSVYLPPCYDQTSTRYPVIYLMHGSNEDDGQWVRLGLPEVLDAGVADGTMPPVIAIMPFGEWIANENRFDRVSWANVFLEELMPLAEQSYRIDTRRETRAIGGISRGGFWALQLAFRHPDLFSAVGGHSAFLDDYHAPPEFNPLRLATSAPGIDRLRIWLDRGKDDYAAPGLDLMDERLKERGVPYQYTVYPEGHHYLTYWKQHVADYLRFYVEDWQGQTRPALPLLATNTPNVSVGATRASLLPTPQPGGVYLFLPVVVFPSLQTTIPADTLRLIAAGGAADKLVLDESAAAALQGYGVALSPAIQIVPLDALYNVLWRDRTRYTLLPVERLSPRYRALRVTDAGDVYGLHPFDMELYPFAFDSSTPNFYRDRLTRLVLSGVTALTRNTTDALDTHGVEWAGEAIKPYVDRADFFHTSNEVSIYPTCPFSNETPLGAFCSKPEHFALFPYIGLDIVELTGNHNNDYGYDAYRETLRFYQDNGIRTVGGGETPETARQPLIIEHNGNTIAMVACNWAGPYYAVTSDIRPGAAACDWDWLRTTLPDLAATSDLLIVTMQHWEYEEYVPTDQQRADFRGMADLGADVVIGTQAHKPQVFEFYNRAQGEQAFLHYGLGNLFFDQPFWGNMRFFMDQVFVYEGRLLGIELFTGIIDDLARPRPMTAEEEFNFLAFMLNTQGGY